MDLLGVLDLICSSITKIFQSIDIQSLFFSQVSERAGFLNPRIWLANHTHVTGPAFYDTAHRPDFFFAA